MEERKTRYEELNKYYDSFRDGGSNEHYSLYKDRILKDISLTLAMIYDELRGKVQ